METTAKTNETILDNAKVAEKLFNDTNSAMMEIYNKQLTLTTGFYNNFINSVCGNAANSGNGINGNFLSNNLIKWPWNSLNAIYGNTNSNPFLGSFDKTYKQLMESNRNFLAEFYNQIKVIESDWTSINKEYIGTLEKRIENSKKLFDGLVEAYNKQLNFSFETEKSMIEDINGQFNSILKQNQKFWADTLQAYQVPSNGEEKTVKNQPETKAKNAAVFQ